MQIEEEYLQKVTDNKNLVATLRKDLIDNRDDLEKKEIRIETIQKEIKQLEEELEKFKLLTFKQRKVLGFLVQSVGDQEVMAKQRLTKMEQQREEMASLKATNQLRQKELEENRRRLHEEEGLVAEQIRESDLATTKWNEVVNSKLEWEEKIRKAREEYQRRQRDLKGEQNETEALEGRNEMLTAEKSASKYTRDAAMDKLQRVLGENLELGHKIDVGQKALMEAMMSLQKDQLYLERMNAREAELKRYNAKVEETVREMEAALNEEQSSYTAIMHHMRSSIEEDEKAINILTQQAHSLKPVVK